MSTIGTLKNKLSLGTGKFVLLSIATLGIYDIVWLYRVQPMIEEEAGETIADKNYYIYAAAALGWMGFWQGLTNSDDSGAALEGLAAVANLVVLALYIYWSFKAKSVLTRYALRKYQLELKTNAFYTVIFQIFYINYCINNLPEVLEKRDILENRDPQKS